MYFHSDIHSDYNGLTLFGSAMFAVMVDNFFKIVKRFVEIGFEL